MKILSIQSSVRNAGSISRQLSDDFTAALAANYPAIDYKKRDVGLQPPAHPTELWTQGNYMEPEARSPEMTNALAESDMLIEELFWAEYLVLGVPMYNFSVPSTLKAYIDNIVRINRTFSFDPDSYAFKGLTEEKKALIITPSAGNFVVGSEAGHLNFCNPYLRSVLGFIGITDISVVAVPNQFMGDEARQEAIAQAKNKLNQIAIAWSAA